jgi:hypothetical protein
MPEDDVASLLVGQRQRAEHEWLRPYCNHTR